MKTKELEVYIAPTELEEYEPKADVYLQINCGKHEDYWLKAKLIIELPDKKAEITESEYFEMTKDFMVHAEIKNGPLLGSYQDPTVKWARKLFHDN